MSIPRSKFDKIRPVVCRVLTHDDDQSEQAELLVGVFKRGTESLEARDVSAQTEYSEGRVKKIMEFWVNNNHISTLFYLTNDMKPKCGKFHTFIIFFNPSLRILMIRKTCAMRLISSWYSPELFMLESTRDTK